MYHDGVAKSSTEYHGVVVECMFECCLSSAWHGAHVVLCVECMVLCVVCMVLECLVLRVECMVLCVECIVPCVECMVP